MDATALATTPEQLEAVKREFDLSALDEGYNRSIHPDSRSPPPLPSVPVIIGTAPKSPQADKASQ